MAAAIVRVGDLQDPRLGDYARVGDPAWLRERGLFVAEGRLVVRRLIEHRRFAVESILLTGTALASMEDVASGAECPVYVCERETLNHLTGFNFHRGCLALARRGDRSPVNALLGARVLVAMEGVANPDNVGGIFRNALALGADGVLLDPTSGDPLYRKAIRTSMAATLRVPFARAERWPGDLTGFTDAGFAIVALTPHGAARDIEDVARDRAGERLMLLLGHEGSGLSAEALSASTVRCRIPIDPASDSLNVAVASGIALARLAPFSSRSSSTAS